MINQAPYVGERAWNGLRLAITALSMNLKVNVFLIDDGVYVARKGHKPPGGAPNLEDLLKRALQMGATIKVCGTCINSREFEPEGEFGICFIGKKDGGITPSDLVEGVGVGSMMELTEWIRDSAKVVSF